MNTEDAILAHARWKIKLTMYLKKPDGTIDINQLQSDDKCELGRWIHGDGAKHKALPEFAALQTAHARFHRLAADVVRKADGGRIANPDALLGTTSEFGAASSSVVNSIKTLARKLSGAVAA